MITDNAKVILETIDSLSVKVPKSYWTKDNRKQYEKSINLLNKQPKELKIEKKYLQNKEITGYLKKRNKELGIRPTKDEALDQYAFISNFIFYVKYERGLK